MKLVIDIADLILCRKLIGQALGDKRLLLTRDAKLLRYKYLIENQIYIVKSLVKDKQLNEVTHYLINEGAHFSVLSEHFCIY